MLVALAQAIVRFPEPYLVGAILSLVLFVGWVIISERRTRHLAKLIRAARGSVRESGGASDIRRRARR
jgi:hypothetical protein